MKIPEKLIKNITLDIFWGGFGNNIQQIALAIMYTKKYNKNFFLINHPLIEDFKFLANPFFSRIFYPIYKNRFFYYGSKKLTEIKPDYPITFTDYEYYKNHFHSVIKEIIKPKVKFIKEIKLDDNLLVLHVRNLEGHPDYVSNPISYYKYLFEIYENILLVTDNTEMPIIKELQKLKNIEIQSSTMENDFNTLIAAKNLATSGVGTYSISAAMMSKNLVNFYYSSFYLDRHLNPEMLNAGINKTEIQLLNYPGFGKWSDKPKILEKYLLSEIKYKIKTEFI